jgi:hypothetical protein
MVSDDSEVGMELVSWDLLFESSCCAELEQRKNHALLVGCGCSHSNQLIAG